MRRRYATRRAEGWRPSGSFHSPTAPRHYPPDMELEPVHRVLDLWIKIEARRVDATVVTTVEARREGPQRLELDAVDLQFEDVASGDEHPLTWTYDGKKLTVHWQDPVPKGEYRELVMRYHVVSPSAGIYFSAPSEEDPHRPRFALTDHETERARHWLPCIDAPNVRTTLDIKLRAEASLTALANGELVSEAEHPDGTKTSHWRLEQRCPSYLTCVTVGDYVRADDGEFEGRPIAYFAPPPFTAEDLTRSFGDTGRMLAWMTDKLGHPFPYPKYFQVAVPGIGGAMENISLVTWDDLFVLDETLAKEWGPLTEIINLHEMAHSYFGDMIVCRDYAHAWLKESWATYMEMCWWEDMYGEDERAYDFYLDAERYFQEADGRYKRPLMTRVFDTSWDLYDAHLYPGGACRLHTLRSLLGDDVFWAAVRDYVQQYAHEVVETDDFRRVLERHSGRSLGRFFDQWFCSPGYPLLKVSFDYERDNSQGLFTIEQTQPKDEPTFELELELAWMVNGELTTRTLHVHERRQQLIVDMPSEPSQVLIDPHAKTLQKIEFSPGPDKLRAQVAEGPTVTARIHAAHRLAKRATALDLHALVAAYHDEAFWGVRVEITKALGNAGVGSAIPALIELIALEDSPRVLSALFDACAKYRDRRLRDTLLSRLERGGLPYRALASLYQALGAQRSEAPLERLMEAATTPTALSLDRGGAIQALAATRSSEVIDTLIDLTAVGEPERVRWPAVLALGTLAKHLEGRDRERVIERLIDLLRDDSTRLQRFVPRALETAEAKEAIEALDAFARPRANQERIAIHRQIAAIRQSRASASAATESQLAALTDLTRKLEERIQKLEAKLAANDGE